MHGLQPSNEVLNLPEYSALSQFLKGKESCGTALDAFCEPVEDVYMKTTNPQDAEDRLWKVWRILIAAAGDCEPNDATQQKLAEFVLELQRRPTLEKDGQVCEVQGMTVWKDLPIFGWELRETWNAAASDDEDEATRQRWLSVNAWTAQLVAAAHKHAHDKPDMSLYCIWTVRSAFEEKQQPSNTALSAAAMWLIGAAPAVWDFCRAEKTFDGKVAKPGSLCSDQEWRGFTRDRWRYWNQRLQDLHGQISDQQTSQYVESARKAIGDVVER